MQAWIWDGIDHPILFTMFIRAYVVQLQGVLQFYVVTTAYSE